MRVRIAGEPDSRERAFSLFCIPLNYYHGALISALTLAVPGLPHRYRGHIRVSARMTAATRHRGIRFAELYKVLVSDERFEV